MPFIHKVPNTRDKLTILSRDSQYDLACACGITDTDRRQRSEDDKWVYPVALENGHKTFLFKTLVSNVCINSCRYCPLRATEDLQRCTLGIEETVDTFLAYYRARHVQGIFLTSGVIKTPDDTMDRIISIAASLRKKHGFKGYMHLKIIPGASDAAIESALALASAVSVNIESSNEESFNQLCPNKDYVKHVVRSIDLISRLTRKGAPYSGVKQTTQFVVGASDEIDQQIVSCSWRLYKKKGLNRVYFSAYQRGLGESDLPGEISPSTNSDILMREHRLYQVDFLFRKYGFKDHEIPFEKDGNLSLSIDPKELWAKQHREFFPVDINRADKYELLRIPGFGPITVNNVLKIRKNHHRIRSMDALGKSCKRFEKAKPYIKFG